MTGKIEDLTGKKFNDWTVIEFYERKSVGTYWLCRCSCGIEKPVLAAEIKRGESKSCGHNKKVDISGQTVGEWTVLEKIRVDKIGKQWVSIYLCKCSCGKIKEVRYPNLSTGKTTNCGHENRVHPDIEPNMIFGQWTVIKKEDGNWNNAAMWLCRCSCGTERMVYGQSLLIGLSTNCGHEHNDGISVGDMFGRLKVTSFYGRGKKGEAIWECLCDCGNYKNIKGQLLKSGNCNSCGCYGAEMSSIRATELAIKNNGHFVKNYDWYIRSNDDIIYCKSSFEVLVWNHFNFVLNEEIQYEPKTFLISKKSRYTPDFYLPKFDIWMETKGRFGEKSNQEKNIRFLIEKKGLDIRILFWEDIVDLCKLKYKTLKSYFDNSEKFNISIESYLGDAIYLNQ